jgi:hypothetical protein
MGAVQTAVEVAIMAVLADLVAHKVQVAKDRVKAVYEA